MNTAPDDCTGLMATVRDRVATLLLPRILGTLTPQFSTVRDDCFRPIAAVGASPASNFGWLASITPDDLNRGSARRGRSGAFDEKDASLGADANEPYATNAIVSSTGVADDFLGDIPIARIHRRERCDGRRNCKVHAPVACSRACCRSALTILGIVEVAAADRLDAETLGFGVDGIASKKGQQWGAVALNDDHLCPARPNHPVLPAHSLAVAEVHDRQ